MLWNCNFFRKNDFIVFAGLFLAYCHSCRLCVGWSFLDEAETVRSHFDFDFVLINWEKTWHKTTCIQQDLLQCFQASQFRSWMGTTWCIWQESCRNAVPWIEARPKIDEIVCIKFWWRWWHWSYECNGSIMCLEWHLRLSLGSFCSLIVIFWTLTRLATQQTLIHT